MFCSDIRDGEGKQEFENIMLRLQSGIGERAIGTKVPHDKEKNLLPGARKYVCHCLLLYDFLSLSVLH